MSHDSNCSEDFQMPEDLQKLYQLISSFRSALKDQDLWHAADIVNKMRDFTADDTARKILKDKGVIKCIVKLIASRYHQRERLMVHCSWLLCNIASEDHESVQYIVDLGVLKKAIGLLRHPNAEVKQNTVWLLANIAGDSLEFRDLLIEKENIVKHVEWLMGSAAPRPSLLKHVTWLISNLARGKPYPPFEKVAPLIKYLAYFLKNMKNNEIISNCLWSLSYLSSGDDHQLQHIYNLDLGSKLISWAYNDDVNVQAPALRTLGNMVTESSDQIEALIAKGLLEVYSTGLENPKKGIRKEICWGLSNVMADDHNLIEQVFEFEEGRIIKKLKELFESEDRELVLECLYCFNNAADAGSRGIIDTLINYGVIELMVSKLKIEEDVTMIKLSLDTLECILKVVNVYPDFAVQGKAKVMETLQSCNGLQIIEALQQHPDNDVYNIVARLIEFLVDSYGCE